MSGKILIEIKDIAREYQIGAETIHALSSVTLNIHKENLSP